MTFEGEPILINYDSTDKYNFEVAVGNSDGFPFHGLDNLTTVEIRSLSTIKTTTKSYLVDEIGLVSNIGGGLGLALGVSFFSVLDFILTKLLDQIP